MRPTRDAHTRGAGVIETLVAAAVGVALLGVLTGALASGARALVRTGQRAEASDTSGLAGEAFLFDVRAAGYDPTLGGVAPLTEARSDRLTVDADLDGDGLVDLASAEHVSWFCNLAAGRLSRIVGAQSMPLADGVIGCGLEYLDRASVPLVPPASGLDAAGRADVAAIVLTLRLVPRGGGPPVDRVLAASLRSRP
jgi:hypothetical protein